jgi:ABC-type proline/glycine betaine transport system substrate-binding protein
MVALLTSRIEQQGSVAWSPHPVSGRMHMVQYNLPHPLYMSGAQLQLGEGLLHTPAASMGQRHRLL